MNRARQIVGLLILSTLAATAGAYQITKKIPVPGEGGWDYLAIDEKARRLFISHSTKVQVMDIDTFQFTGEISDTPGVHGVALSPDRGFTSNGKEGSVTMFDRASLKVLGKIKAGQNPDTIIYDPMSRRVFTFNGRSNDSSAIEAATGHISGTIPLGGRPEFAVANGSGTIFVDIEDKNQLVSIDTDKLAVTNRWPTAPCLEPSTIALDSTRRRLFVGCGNKMMAVINEDTGDVLATLPIGEHVDATVYDAARSRVSNANGEGTITVIQVDSPKDFHVAETVPTQRGARTVALDPKTGRLFLVTAEFGPPSVPTAERPKPRPSILPGTMTILVVAPQ